MLDGNCSITPSLRCRICSDSDLDCLTVKEMMFGTKEEFLYLECRSCGCVQISEYPGNIADHYPADYYSYETSRVSSPSQASPGLESLLGAGKRAIMRASKAARRRFIALDSTQDWLRARPVLGLYLKHVPDPARRILDVGCGSGGLLRALDALYYQYLHGVDPFVSGDIYLRGQLLVKKADICDLPPSYDCISFNHVLEHMPDQARALRAAHALLAPDGLVLVRIPVVGGVAWRTYRENWVQLDPPRHYYLHSESSFRLLAGQAGFDVASIEYDSSGFQFCGSELYRRGISLADNAARTENPVFSAKQLAEFDARAEALNRSREGDQIVAILRHKAS
jgi:SAM-dependent methyltransferase